MKTFAEVVEAKLRSKCIEQADSELDLLFANFKLELDKLGVAPSPDLNRLMDVMRKERVETILSEKFLEIASQFV